MADLILAIPMWIIYLLGVVSSFVIITAAVLGFGLIWYMWSE